MAGLSIWHVVIFAIVVILLFGTSKLKILYVGGAVKDFKKSVREEDETTALNTPRTIDAQVKIPDNISKKLRFSTCLM